MRVSRVVFIIAFIFLLPGCAAVPFGIGLIPGAPAYVSSVIGNGQSAYVAAIDERSTKQQMLDAIVAGHAQAELYRHKEIEPLQITAHCYFGKLYLVGEYDSQEQLRTIYECVDKVEGKKEVVSRLYLREPQQESDFFSEQTAAAELEAQLMADFSVTSSPIEIEIVQGDIILLGVISDKDERDRIMAHAQSVAEGQRAISYLYHKEIAGPDPQQMTAKVIPPAKKVSRAPKPPVKKPVIRKKKAVPVKPQKVEEEQPQSVAANTPKPPEVINGRTLGL